MRDQFDFSKRSIRHANNSQRKQKLPRSSENLKRQLPSASQNVFGDNRHLNRMDQERYYPHAMKRIEPDHYQYSSQKRSQLIKAAHRPNMIKKYPVSHSMVEGLPKGKVELFAVTTILFLTMWFLGYHVSPYNKANIITVSGNYLSYSEGILNAANIRMLDSFKYVMKNRQVIEDNIITMNPLVASVIFEKNGWKNLNILVKEHEVIALVANDNQIYPLLENGQLIDEMDLTFIEKVNTEQLPRLVNVQSKANYVVAANALKGINDNIIKQIDFIEISHDVNKPNHLVLLMKDGLYVKGVSTTIAEKINYYDQMKEVIGNQKGVINLEVGAYFTPDVSNVNSIKLDTNLDN